MPVRHTITKNSTGVGLGEKFPGFLTKISCNILSEISPSLKTHIGTNEMETAYIDMQGIATVCHWPGEPGCLCLSNNVHTFV